MQGTRRSAHSSRGRESEDEETKASRIRTSTNGGQAAGKRLAGNPRKRSYHCPIPTRLQQRSAESAKQADRRGRRNESGSWRGRFDIRGRLVPGGAKRESISHGEAIHGASRRTRRVRELKVGSLISSTSNARIDLARSCHRSRLYVNLQRSWRMSHHMWLHHPFHFSRKAAQRLHG
jgi:hypothetical protein